MVARLVDGTFALRHPGEFTVERDEQYGFPKSVTIICPSCRNLCEVTSGILSVEPVSLSDSVVCTSCFAGFWVSEGKVSPVHGTLPKFTEWLVDEIYYR